MNEDSVRGRLDSLVGTDSILPTGFIRSQGIIRAPPGVKIIPPTVTGEELVELLKTQLPYSLETTFSTGEGYEFAMEDIIKVPSKEKVDYSELDPKYKKFFSRGMRSMEKTEFYEPVISFRPYQRLKEKAFLDLINQTKFEGKLFPSPLDDSVLRHISLEKTPNQFPRLLVTACAYGETCNAIEQTSGMVFMKVPPVEGMMVYVPFWEIPCLLTVATTIRTTVGNVSVQDSKDHLEILLRDYSARIIFNGFGEYTQTQMESPVLDINNPDNIRYWEGIVPKGDKGVIPFE